jgi:hypothetical protein
VRTLPRDRAPSQYPVQARFAPVSVAPVSAPSRYEELLLAAAAEPRPRSIRVSTLLAVGGGLAAIALVAVLGIAAGERSAHTSASQAALPVPDPLPVETKSAAHVASATPALPLVEKPAENAPSAAAAELSPASPPQAAAGHAAARTPKAKAVGAAHEKAAALAKTAQAPNSDDSDTQASKAAEPADPAASETALAPEIPSSAPAPVDPLVQAVREDIREDQARTK